MAGSGVVLGSINIVALLITLGMTYYAIRLVTKFRNGLLERPWRHVSFGAISLTAAGIAFALQTATNVPLMSSTLSYSGSILSVVGGALMLFGLRGQNQVWSIRSESSHSSKNDSRLG
ncbi:MAG: hypothetical protein JRN52_00010 [Nitrososphaerota archaeon]|nr:hypothetical protein [Nitrososphaerota archaeon]